MSRHVTLISDKTHFIVPWKVETSIDHALCPCYCKTHIFLLIIKQISTNVLLITKQVSTNVPNFISWNSIVPANKAIKHAVYHYTQDRNMFFFRFVLYKELLIQKSKSCIITTHLNSIVLANEGILNTMHIAINSTRY
jgi:hypothetical protein